MTPGQERLVLEHDRIAHRIADRYTGIAERDDLLQMARLGLVKAAQQFDHRTGVRFSTYAQHFAAGEVRHYARSDAHLIRIDTRRGVPYAMRPLPNDDFLVHKTGDFEVADARMDLATILSRLPRRDRHILALRFLADATQVNIASALGITQKAVSRATTRTLDRARKVATCLA